MFKKSMLTLSIMLGIVENFKKHNEHMYEDAIHTDINNHGFTVNIDDLISNRSISKSTKEIK